MKHMYSHFEELYVLQGSLHLEEKVWKPPEEEKCSRSCWEVKVVGTSHAKKGVVYNRQKICHLPPVIEQ